MEYASIVVLTFLPGAWLAFCPGSGHLTYPARFALAIALSPAVAALQFFGLRLMGLSFQQVVPVLQLLNLGSLLFIGRALRLTWPRLNMRVGLFGAAAYASVAACVAIPWLWNPDFRRYSWHGLLHTDIIYTFARGALLPEEPELAGVALAYPWIGHVFWSLLAWSADLGPTVIYPVTNLVLLLAIGVLYYSLARQLGASEPTALAATVMLALGTNLVGVLGWSIVPANDNGLWWALLGDLRYAPFLLKFVTFETMPFGLVLYAAAAFLAVSALDQFHKFELLLAPLVVVATAALYPNLFPAAALLLVALAGTVLFGQRYLAGRYSNAVLVVFIILSALAALGGLLFVKLYTMGREHGVIEISSAAAMAKKFIAAALALGPFAAALYWQWTIELSERRAPLLLLALAATGALVLNILLRVGGLNEYKFVMAAGICLAAPGMVGFERRLFTTQRARWWPVLAGPPVLALVMLSYSMNRIPSHGSKPLAASASSFVLTLDPALPDSAWIDAVRQQTPLETMIVINHPDFHTTSFTDRVLYVPSQGAKFHFGYNMDSRFNMLVERGYSAELFRHRAELLKPIYANEIVGDPQGVLRSLMVLGRPLAIVYGPNDGRGFLEWLRASRMGADLLVDDNGGRAVYLIRP